MLKNNLKDISNIVLLRSDKILHELLSNEPLINNTSKAYEYGVRDYYPNSFRKGTMEDSMKYTLDKNQTSKFTLDYGFDFLDSLFDEYLKFDGNHIYAKSEILDNYSSVINKIHPFNIIGYKLASKLRQNSVTLQNIKDYAKYITPLAFSVNREFKEYAENHLHLGGSNTESLSFLALLSNPTKKEFYNYDILDKLPRINEFSYINNGHYSFGVLIDIAKYCMSVINSCLVDCNKRENILDDLEKLAAYGRLSMIGVDFSSLNLVDKNQNLLSYPPFL